MFLLDPMRMTFRERAAFAEAVGGYSFSVEAGETLYFPHQWVHGTFYSEPSFSFVQHFGRDMSSMFVSREVHRGFFRHAIMQKLYPAAAVEHEHWAEFLALHDVCKQEYASPRERFVAIDGVLRSLFERFYPDRKVDDLPFELDVIRPLDEAKALAWYAETGPVAFARKAWTQLTEKPLFNWW
jgi:hypothetical protein